MSTDPILLAYASDRPREVARLLAAARPAEIAELLDQLPAKIAASLIVHLPTRQASRLLKDLKPATIAKLLTSARHEDSVALVSQLPVTRYPTLLNAADGRQQQRALKHLLDLPLRTLAALVTPDYIRAHADTICHELRSELESQTSQTPVPIYVVDDEGVYLGEVNPLSLLIKYAQNYQLRELALYRAPLSGRMNIAAALRFKEWNRNMQLPVVNAKGHLLGAINYWLLERQAKEDEVGEYNLTRTVTEISLRFLEMSEYCMRMLVTRRRQ
ncbi:MAG: magnesium transporter MgtE N-terminal domain-containing protein [Gammaproteobacteria bacterium]